jgi:hypothetical protein
MSAESLAKVCGMATVDALPSSTSPDVKQLCAQCCRLTHATQEQHGLDTQHRAGEVLRPCAEQRRTVIAPLCHVGVEDAVSCGAKPPKRQRTLDKEVKSSIDGLRTTTMCLSAMSFMRVLVLVAF